MQCSGQCSVFTSLLDSGKVTADLTHPHHSQEGGFALDICILEYREPTFENNLTIINGNGARGSLSIYLSSYLGWGRKANCLSILSIYIYIVHGWSGAANCVGAMCVDKY